MNPFNPITVEEAPDYLVAAGLAERNEFMVVSELGGGVSSIVILAETRQRRVIIKQALPKLRVQADWPSRPDRSMVEVAAIQAWAPLVPPNAIPQVLHTDPERHCFVMTAAPAAAINWKTQLLAGHVDQEVAARAGTILAAMHRGSARDPAIMACFDDREFFYTLRVDPYLLQVCRVHPSLRPIIEPLVNDMLSHRQVLVHGDYSPKNILVHDTTLLVLDFEVAHWGDSAFDLAFCLNHFVLKSMYKAPNSAPYLNLARAFWSAYASVLTIEPIEPTEVLLRRALLLQGALLLARVDGKSPAEYITDPAMRERIRRVSLERILAERPSELEQSLAIVQSATVA